MLIGHGGDRYSLARELGVDPAKILDFSSNVSPLGPPHGLLKYLKARIAEIEYLPEVDSFELRNALAHRYKADPGDFFVTSGTTEWIFHLPQVLRPKKVIIPLPTYSDYRDASLLHKLSVEEIVVWKGEESGQIHNEFPIRLEERLTPGSLVFLCNPNNPTGSFIPPESLCRLIAKYPEVKWVVDESYAPFAAPDEKSSLLFQKKLDNLIILRSFSKIYGIPGLRLGYAMSSDPSAILAKALKPWAVNRLAQLAGKYLLDENGGYEESIREFIKTEMARMFAEISRIPFLRPYQTNVNFMLIEVLKPFTAGKVAESLRKKGILIRDCSNFLGLSGEFIRISLRQTRDNDILLDELKALGAGSFE